MGTGQRAQVGLGDDFDIQRVLELLVEQVCLMYTCLDVPLPRFFEVLHREVVVIDLVAILALGTTANIGTSVGEVERRIAPQLGGNEMQARIPSAISRASWLPKCPSSTRYVTESTAIIRWSNA